MANLHSQFIYDDNLNMQDAGLVAASANGDYIVDLGDGLFDGFLVVDVSAIEVASSDELYILSLEGSASSSLASGSVNLADMRLGAAAVIDPLDSDSAVGRYAIPVRNEQNGTLYRYVRLRMVVSGTVATGINLSAFLAPR